MRILIAALVLAFGVSAPAFANGYVEGTAAYSQSDDLDSGNSSFAMESGYLIGLAIGGTLANQVSLEGEVTYSDRDFENYDANLVAIALMANLYYNFQVANAVSGYFGLGLGGVQVEVENSSFSDSEVVFGYQFMAGMMYGLANGVWLFGEYRYQAAQEAGDGSNSIEYNSHNIGGGIRAGF